MAGTQVRGDGVLVELDRPRRLRLTFNALVDLEQVTGIDGLDFTQVANLLDSKRAEHRRALLWALLRTEDPELTLEQAGDLLRMDQTGAIQGSMLEAFMQAIVPDGAAAEPESEPGEAPAVSASPGRKRGR